MITLFKDNVRLNLINHFVGFIPYQFACNSTFRNPVFRWESCKSSVWESVKKKLKSMHSAGSKTGSHDWFATGKSPKEAHVWSKQRSWRVTPTGALQDKISSLARLLARYSDSRLSQVMRLSRQITLFGKNWPFAFQTNTRINTPNTHVL